jgi:hypothetical protein
MLFNRTDCLPRSLARSFTCGKATRRGLFKGLLAVFQKASQPPRKLYMHESLHPNPSQKQRLNMENLMLVLMKEAERLEAGPSEIVSTALSIIGSIAISVTDTNRRAIVDSLCELARMIEDGELTKQTKKTMASSKASTLH